MVTLDNVMSLAHSTILNPLCPLLLTAYQVVYRNEKLSVALPQNRGAYLPTVTASSTVRKCLAYLFFTLSMKLSDWRAHQALNNGVSDTYNWDEEVVVVTGGAGGIGGEVVKQLAARGIKVAVLDVIPLTYDKPASVEYFKCDLTNAQSLSEAANAVRAKWGNPTVLCCIAGIVRHSLLLEAPRRDWDLTFGVNVIGVALCYKEFVPDMAKRDHGHVVTIASQTAYLAGAPGMVHYAASKSAALALHEGLSAELKHAHKAPRVRTTVLCPGVVATKMFTGLTSPSEFFMPKLRPEDVAAEITAALMSGISRHIEQPIMAKWISPLAKVMPAWYRVALQNGAKDAMKSFSGHKTMD